MNVYSGMDHPTHVITVLKYVLQCIWSGLIISNSRETHAYTRFHMSYTIYFMLGAFGYTHTRTHRKHWNYWIYAGFRFSNVLSINYFSKYKKSIYYFKTHLFSVYTMNANICIVWSFIDCGLQRRNGVFHEIAQPWVLSCIAIYLLWF